MTRLGEDVRWRSRGAEAAERSVRSRERARAVLEWEEGLKRRRAALREKLAREDERHAAEMAGTRTSADARRMALETRARKLLDDRERARRRYVEEMEYKKWKESNEECRAQARAELSREVVLGRQMQIDERRRLAEEEGKRTKRINAAILRRRAENSALLDARDESLRASRDAHSLALREQMAERERDRHERFERQRADRARLNAQWETDATTYEQNQSHEALRRRDSNAALLKENELRRLELLSELKRERERDAKIIESAIEKERLYEEEQAQLAQRRMDEEILFRSFLDELVAEQHAKNESDDLTIEEDRLRHEQKVRERENLENYQRQQLMQEVNAVRGQQIAEAEAKRRAEDAEEREWRKRNEEDMELARRQLDEKLRIAKEENVKHRKALEGQIRDKGRAEPSDYGSTEERNVEREERFARRFEEEVKTTKVYSF